MSRKIIVDKKTGKKYYEATREDYSTVGLHWITLKIQIGLFLVLFLLSSPAITFILATTNWNVVLFDAVVMTLVQTLSGVCLTIWYICHYDYIPTKSNHKKYDRLLEMLEVKE